MSQHLVALQEYLEPLAPFLSDPFISEIAINTPGEIFIERRGQMTAAQIPALTYHHLRGLADLIARYYNKTLNESTPLLSATLPSHHRIQIVIPPACEAGKVIMTIRKPVTAQMSLEDLNILQTFEETKPCYLSRLPKKASRADDAHLLDLFHQRNYKEFLKCAIKQKKNILISGATSSGKTTLLNACLQEIPIETRIITLEDVREISFPHQNAVHLLASHLSLQRLIEISLRLRPDRIIIGEIRGSEVIDFCHANQTGHSGTMASIHAEHPEQVFDRLVQLTRRYSNMGLSREDILHDWIALIDIIVQMKRVQDKRIVSDIYFASASQR